MCKSLVLVLGILLSISTLNVHGDPLVPCYFIFGDSLSDAGNNNALKTQAVANYFPYGIDYLVGGRPTGRFTNGHTIVDVIAEQLKFQEDIAPFSSANDQQIINGVNYASGSAGILPETGEHLGDRISLGRQIGQHKTIISRLGPVMTNGSVPQHLKSCLYTINIGSNDFINNYFMPDRYSSSRYNFNQFTDLLIFQYSRQIMILHENGARKFGIFGVGKVGCVLAEIVRFKPKTLCVDSINNAVSLFNQKLETLLQMLITKLPDSKFVYVNMQAIQVGPQQGITVEDKPCCTLRDDFQCVEFSITCYDRDTHYFWDGFHPTEAVNKVTGVVAFRALASIL